MKLRGRRFLTRVFLFLTGGLILVLFLGNAYFMMEPSAELQRMLAIPLFGGMLWIFYRFVRLVALHQHIHFIFGITGISLVLGYLIKATRVVPVRRVRSLVRKLKEIWTR